MWLDHLPLVLFHLEIVSFVYVCNIGWVYVCHRIMIGVQCVKRMLTLLVTIRLVVVAMGTEFTDMTLRDAIF